MEQRKKYENLKTLVTSRLDKKYEAIISIHEDAEYSPQASADLLVYLTGLHDNRPANRLCR